MDIKKIDNDKRLAVASGALILKNPVVTSSGTYGYGKEFEEFYDVSLLGAITTKGLTLQPKPGNPSPRIYEAASGMLNSIGLANIGIKNVMKEYSDYFSHLRKNGCKIIANINAANDIEFIEIAEIADSWENFDYLEVNVSCPNVKQGGIAFSSSCLSVYSLVHSIKKKVKKPIITKLSPNVADIKEYVKTAEDAGTDIISLINTFKSMSIDINTMKPRFANIHAGYSGPAIKPIALFMTYQARSVTKLPIIAMGGIGTISDALEFIMAGADAVSIGTMNLIDPMTAYGLLQDMLKYCKDRDKNIKCFVSKAQQ